MQIKKKKPSNNTFPMIVKMKMFRIFSFVSNCNLERIKIQLVVLHKNIVLIFSLVLVF